jgi:hypothetical protein
MVAQVEVGSGTRQRVGLPWAAIGSILFGLCWILPFPTLLYFCGYPASALAVLALTLMSRVARSVRRHTIIGPNTVQRILLDRDLRQAKRRRRSF